MPTLGGVQSKGKIIKVRPYDEEGDDKLLWLTERQRGLMLAMTEYLDWKTRWETLPSPLDNDDTRDAYVSELKNRLMIVVEFCAEVINCITNDEDTINAFNSYLLNQLLTNPTFATAIAQALQTAIGGQNSQGTATSNLVFTPDDCDNDALFGSIRVLVKWMHQNNTDFLERIAQAATPASRAQALSEVIPEFTGGFLGQALSEAITYISGALKTNYEAYYDQSYEDDLICELFCLAQSDCNISVSDLYNVFIARVGYTSVGVDTFIQAFTFVVTGEVTGIQFADVMFMLQVGAFKFMGGFVAYRGLNPLSNAISQGWDDPSDDWEDCECVVEVFIFASVDTIDDGGTDTTFDVIEGHQYSLRPAGVWQGGTSINYDARGNIGVTNPSDVVPTADIYSLVVKVGTTGTYFSPGGTFIFVAPETGRLYAAINDVPGAYSDNSGSIRITPAEII